MVTLYIEGGEKGKAAEARFREFWHKLFENILRFKGRKFRIFSGGGRDDAYDDLCIGLKTASLGKAHGDNFALLIDSERSIDFVYSGNCQTDDEQILSFLNKHYGWEKPQGYVANHIFLMVSSMESWILADTDSLKRHYGDCFNLKSTRANPESLSPEEAYRILRKATETCDKPYKKGSGSFEVLAKLDPEIIAKRCPSFAHFIKCVPI